MRRRQTQTQIQNPDIDRHLHRRLMIFVNLVIVVWTALGPMAATLLEHAHSDAATQASAANHEDGTPCPDRHGDKPCNNDCPCLCCPGNKTVPTKPLNLHLVAQKQPIAQPFSLPDAPHPAGVLNSIYRPPRG